MCAWGSSALDGNSNIGEGLYVMQHIFILQSYL